MVGRLNKEENKRLALRAEHKRLLRDGGLGEAVQEQPENGAGLCLSLCNERSEYRWLQGGMLQVAQVGGAGIIFCSARTALAGFLEELRSESHDPCLERDI